MMRLPTEILHLCLRARRDVMSRERFARAVSRLDGNLVFPRHLPDAPPWTHSVVRVGRQIIHTWAVGPEFRHTMHSQRGRHVTRRTVNGPMTYHFEPV